ncbi:putative esterase [Fibrisoma limi BUZ 3]|uniref:Putative esterase n=1 Tax=Fibrisoma limi BUZ 3 TaxID=1185876 RepID=I2GK58_9BACT|nr:putative esterase [Fibrisoma limi]CCH54283.1 putative esterase [Fibrisoma limi BUZ 3]
MAWGAGKWPVAAAHVEQARRKPPSIEEHQFYCHALGREVPYAIYLPSLNAVPQDSFPVLFILHGDGRTYQTIISDEACRRNLINRKIAVVFPNGERGWYLDSRTNPTSQYQSMLVELLAHIRQTYPVYRSGKQTGIAGWSMGGFGAMHFAETYPHQVSAVATTIGLVDFPNPRLPKAKNYPVSAVFGMDTTAWAGVNCLNRAEKLAGKQILLIAGKKAFDHTMNHHFHRRLQQLRIPHQYVEWDENHDFMMVRKSLPVLLDFFERTLKRP